MKFRWILFVGLSLMSSLGCHRRFSGDPTLRISVRTSEDRSALDSMLSERYSAPTTVSGFDCLLLTVTGENVAETYSDLQAPCTSSALGLGATSTLVSTQEFLDGRAELTLQVRRGEGRQVRLLGVDTPDNDGTCGSQALPQLFSETTRPFMYEISKATVNIAEDTEVSLSNMYRTSSLETRDLVDECRPKRELAIEPFVAYTGPTPDSYAILNENDALLTPSVILPPIWYEGDPMQRLEQRSNVLGTYTWAPSMALTTARVRADFLFSLESVQLSLFSKWKLETTIRNGKIPYNTSTSTCTPTFDVGAGFVASVWDRTQWRDASQVIDYVGGNDTFSVVSSNDQNEAPSRVSQTEGDGTFSKKVIHISVRSRDNSSSVPECSAMVVRDIRIILKP